jgi:hypothetical protein
MVMEIYIMVRSVMSRKKMGKGCSGSKPLGHILESGKTIKKMGWE